MNTPNNKRRQATRERIEKAFVQLLQEKTIARITVSEICQLTGYNRSTFYANYADVYELADTIRAQLEAEVAELFDNDIVNNVGYDYRRLFAHIQENQLFYQLYFKLGYDATHIVSLGSLKPERLVFPEEHMAYHIEFHKAGLNAIIKRWLKGGCVESPEEMAQIVCSEYQGRSVPRR